MAQHYFTTYSGSFIFPRVPAAIHLFLIFLIVPEFFFVQKLFLLSNSLMRLSFFLGCGFLFYSVGLERGFMGFMYSIEDFNAKILINISVYCSLFCSSSTSSTSSSITSNYNVPK